MIQLENNKDYYVPFDTIVNYFMETFESLIDKTSEYKNNLDLEMQDLLSRDFEKITDEVLQNFKLLKLQQRRNELMELMKQTTDQEEKNRIESEIREIISNIVRK